MKGNALDLVQKLREEQKKCQFWAEQHFETINDGHFMAIGMNENECVLSPYPEFSAYLYRGQQKYFDPCLSSLYRSSPSKIDRLIATIRIAEFQLLLAKHPAVSDFSSWSVMNLRIKIDYEGIAQHYGLKTELIDFTSNPHVAAFFACSEYDVDLGEYRPVLREGQGIIYTCCLAAVDSVEPLGQEQPYLSAIGLQPLPRSAEQYAWCYRLPQRESLNSQQFVSSISFVHDPKVSKEIFEKFEGGAKLFPYNPVSEKAREIAETDKFSRDAFNLVMSKCGQGEKEKEVLNSLTDKGIEIVDQQQIVFTDEEQLDIERKWNERREELLARIHYRRACYPI